MNLATSRRLRPSPLLLLLPLLMASTPPLPPLPSLVALTTPGQPDHVAFVGLPPEFLLSRCTQVGVELRDSTDAPVKTSATLRVTLMAQLVGGAFYTDTCSSNPVDAVDILADTTGRQLWFKPSALGGVALVASDGAGGLGDALTRVISVVSSLTTELRLSDVPSTAQAGVAFNVTVTAFNQDGVASGYAGTVHFTSSDSRAILPPNYTFDPLTDAGSKKFPVTLQSVTTSDLTVQDANTALTPATSSEITVQAPPAGQLKVDILTTPVRAGEPVTFRVVPLDTANSPTTRGAQLKFSTDVAQAQLPQDTPASSTATLPASFTATFYTAGPDTKHLTVTDVSVTPNITQTTDFVVQPGPATSMVLSAAPSTTVPACGEVAINLDAFDAAGNPTVEPINEISLCKSQDRSATYVRSTLSGPVVQGDCVLGTVMGHAQVIWTDPVEEQVEFKVNGINTKEPILISWKAGIPSLATSSLQFVETSELVPPLRTYTGKLTLQLTLRDLCQKPAPLPAGKALTFAADSPLFVAAPEQDAQEKNVWRVSTRLSACPSPLQPLAIWPLINGEQLTLPSGTRIERRVLPQCLAPDVQLKLLTAAEARVVEPGELSAFEVEVSNSSEQTITDGVLRVSGSGLSVLSASIGDTPLTAKGEGFGMPELRKDAPLTVKVHVQATTQPVDTVQATVWAAHVDGSPLTEETPVSFTAEKLGVDVGCGCHAASPASQLLPWLALLLLASRPWVRLRRLRRGERTEH